MTPALFLTHALGSAAKEKEAHTTIKATMTTIHGILFISALLASFLIR
jgi:hypothetical protein